MIQKNIFKRLLIGAKKGILTPNLPSHILKIHNSVLIRIFRFLGGLSTILIVSNKLSILGNGILYISALYICFIITTLFSIYLMFLNYHRIKHIYKVLKNKELDVYNSPFDK